MQGGIATVIRRNDGVKLSSLPPVFRIRVLECDYGGKFIRLVFDVRTEKSAPITSPNRRPFAIVFSDFTRISVLDGSSFSRQCFSKSDFPLPRFLRAIRDIL